MTKFIPLNSKEFAIVDDEDFELASQYTWNCTKRSDLSYARTSKKIGGKQFTIRLHRLLLSAGPGEMVDHRNGDGLDCRRSNLRFATRSQNAQNKKRRSNARSQYKGLVFSGNSIAARINFNGKVIHIGSFLSEIEAARAYDAMARELFGEFARTNFEA